MLKLDLKLRKEQQSIRLGKIRDRFATYFGFVPSGSISEALALNQTINLQRQNEGTNINPGERLRLTTDPEAVQVFNIFLDTGSGALKAISDRGTTNGSREVTDRSIKGRIQSLLNGADEQRIRRCSSYVQMHYSNAHGAVEDRSAIFHSDLDNIGFNDDNISNNAKLKMSAFRMIHPLLTPGGKNSDLLTIFFNAFPTLELTRATPVLNIKMYSSRQVFQDGRLAAISLQKTLEGAVEAPDGTTQNSALRAIGLANQISSSNFGDSGLDFQYYSIAGMELFRAPQTMVNPDAAKIQSNFLAPIIDPFRPLASIKSFDVDVKSAVGLISTKTAKLELVLHDRSRMGEFADIIKPDRYGTSFIEAEYGWSHPDQMQDDPNSLDGNPYADILNLTRTKEHYNITNSSFSFDEVGQVNITLNLVTRGSSEMTELSITGNQEFLRQQLTVIADISKEINRLSSLVYGNQDNNQNGSSTHRREIRGQQILGAAGDATNMLVVNSDMLTDLIRLRSSLDNIISTRRSTQSSDEVRRNARSLSSRIDSLIGPANRNTGNIQAVSEDSAIGRVQASVNNNIRAALELINRNGTDPISSDIFLKTMPTEQQTYFRTHQTRTAAPVSTRSNSTAAQAIRSENNQLLDTAELNSDPGLVNRKPVVSLGTLFMAFVAKPLAAMQEKFEEVQVYFYNFNNKASIMSHCNISQFPVTTDYFAREYSRLRLENLNRSVNLSLIDFVNFLSTKMVDDPMNPAYGINDLYKYNNETRELEINTNNREIGTNQERSQDNFNRIMRARMEQNNIGHAPDFQMPQLTIDIEAVPYFDDERKTILKLHVYDKACSSTAPLRELLSLSTENLMSTLSSFPANQDAATAEVAAQSNAASQDSSQPSARARRGRNTPAVTTTFDEHHLRQNWRDSYRIILDHATRENIITDLRANTSSDSQPADAQPTGTQQQSAPRPVNPLYRFTGGPKRLKEMVMQYVPHIIYGSMYSTVKSANLSTQQNAQLATINMLRSLNGDPVAANGEQAGGVPLSVYPCELSITTLGCPFIRYSQEIFVDFNTNTTADNIYYVTGLTHKIEAGNYETTIKLTPNDAFGQYRNMISQLNTAGSYINDLSTHDIPERNNTTSQQHHHHHRRRR